MRRWSVLAAVTVVAIGCASDGDRPDPGEWRVMWEEVQAAIPDRSELDVADPTPLCEDAMGVLREMGPSLSPTPDRAADEAVDGWLSTADETFFECPPQSGELTGFDEAYQELERFRREVEDGLG
jgi:hypothetical protein